ncbi:MAG: alginate O-acetyltransferase AlgF [Sinimarinibacterium sp.]|jgi:alginate O-acetyltransferase complex protein AlgF
MTDIRTRTHGRGLFVTTLVAGLLLCANAAADDAALYGPEAPPGSAFIRVLNATDTPELDVQVGGALFEDVRSWTVSAFDFVPAGSTPLAAGDTRSTLNLTSDRFYTAVVAPGGVQLFTNERYRNRLKALLILYNLTDADDLSARTADGQTAVVDAISRNNFGVREVNPARTHLALYAGDRRATDTPMLTLSRGKALSVFVVGPASAPRVVWSEN